MAKKIQVVMLEDVKNIGRKNEIINVSIAYAKNVLLPKNQATIATKDILDKLQRKQDQKQAGHDELTNNIETMLQTLKSDGLTIQGKSNPSGKLFAKLDNKSVAQVLTEKFGFVVDAKILHVEKIDHTGEYDVKINFEKIKSVFTLIVTGTK